VARVTPRIQIDSNTPPEIQAKALELEAGWLGRCFGAGRNASVNIAGGSLIALILLGAALLFLDAKGMTASEYWKLVTPIITLILGYLFAK